jgi:hypothetical protein
MDAHALVETVFFATVVLETTRTPVKEVVKADIVSRASGDVTQRPRAEAYVFRVTFSCMSM